MTSRSLSANPLLDTWIRLDREGRVTVRTGKVELGQGLVTALAMIVAEELDVDIARIDVRTADTEDGPNEIITAGSMSIEQSGAALRQAAAEARRRLLVRASERLGVAVDRLRVDDGSVRAPGLEAVLTYWQLAEGQRFEGEVGDAATPKAVALHRVVGRAGPGLGLEALVTTGAQFVQDLTRPGLLYGRVVRPNAPGSRLESVDTDRIRSLPGVVALVRDGSFLGLVAEREEQAVAAAEALRASAQWTRAELPFDESELFERLVSNPRRSLPVVDGAATEGTVPPIVTPRGAAVSLGTPRTLRASYRRPYHMHASIGPSAALAEWVDGTLSVWSHSQSVHLLRQSLAEALGLDAERVHVVHVPGPGCYGHNGADDAALDAALLAQAVPGRPVRLQWSREDEHLWEPYGSAMCVALQASLDVAGQVIDWHHDVYSDTHGGRPFPHGPDSGVSGLLAAGHREPAMERPPKRPSTGFHSGIHRNADPLYCFPRRRIVKHLVAELPLRTSSLRGLGAYANVFAIESFMDELAQEAGVDPAAFRLAHLDDERARAVIEAVVTAAGPLGGLGAARGRGLGFARYENHKTWAAVIAELRVADDGAIQLERLVIAADAGEIVDPDGLRNQLEGGAIQSASWTLVERVRFDRRGVRSRDWDTYPILEFAEIPAVHTVLLDRPGSPSLGAGEAVQGPAAAAIANAVYAAIGVRLREIPFTPAQVRQVRRSA